MTSRGRMHSTRRRRKLDQVVERDGKRCCYCHKRVDLTLGDTRMGPTLEHVVPLGDGGTNALDNLKLAHRLCNLKQNGRYQRQANAA